MADKNNPAARVSPKVSSAGAWAAIAGLAATVLTGIGTNLDPHLFDGLGPWGGVIYTAIIGVAAVLGGYLKGDPLRDAGASAITPPLPAPGPFPVVADPIVPSISPEVAAAAAEAGETPATAGTFGSDAAKGTA